MNLEFSKFGALYYVGIRYDYNKYKIITIYVRGEYSDYIIDLTVYPDVITHSIRKEVQTE